MRNSSRKTSSVSWTTPWLHEHKSTSTTFSRREELRFLPAFLRTERRSPRTMIRPAGAIPFLSTKDVSGFPSFFSRRATTHGRKLRNARKPLLHFVHIFPLRLPPVIRPTRRPLRKRQTSGLLQTDIVKHIKPTRTMIRVAEFAGKVLKRAFLLTLGIAVFALQLLDDSVKRGL